jgi:hypothetical protein
MAQVIEFPRGRTERADQASALEPSLEQAVAACLSLSTKFEGMISDLERSLALLCLALNNSPNGASEENSRKIAELKGQLVHARGLLDAARRDLAERHVTT